VGLATNKIYQMDCIEGLKRIAPGSVDLAFADPPFNIGYEYDVYHDRRDSDEYVNWSQKWMHGIHKALKPDGTFWLAIGDEYAAELKMIAQKKLGFACRSWVIWYYTFGVNCVRAFSRSHTHLFHFVKDPQHFTFNADDPAVRVPSARQLVYGDNRANPKGRLPDNTWILRPQDLPTGFQPDHDTWYFPRVAGTFKEREGFHGCQMPEQLLGRIIRSSSNPKEVVLDPFGGSGTTFSVAKKLGRQWIGFELSKDYVERINSRLSDAGVGAALDGVADPLTSAPSTDAAPRGLKATALRAAKRAAASPTKEKKTASPKKPKRANARTAAIAAEAAKPSDEVPAKAEPKEPLQVVSGNRAKRSAASEDYVKGLIDAYKATHQGFSVDHVLANVELNHAFLDACGKKGLNGQPVEWNQTLLRVRKSGKLPRGAARSRACTFVEMDLFSFASEVAMQQLSVESETTLDGILCDPSLAARFDELAATFSPGYSSFQYRWAALALRKRAKTAKKLAEGREPEWIDRRLPTAKKLSDCQGKRYACPGVYVLSDRGKQCLYVGETMDLARRIELTSRVPAWTALNPERVAVIPDDRPVGLQALLVARLHPTMNSHLLIPGREAAA
jgi:site-specific DNA-methyltransferase (adenine-specific)